MSTTGLLDDSTFHARRRAPRWLLSAALMVASSSNAVAFAQSASLAEQLFDQGNGREESGAHEEACALFQASVTLEAAPASRLKVAACWEREGKVTAAAAELRALLEIARKVPGPKGQEIQEDIEHRLSTVQGRMAKLRVVVPAGRTLVISLDGEVVSEKGMRDWLLLDPGMHRLEVVTADGGDIARSVQIDGGEEKTIDIGPLVPARPGGAAPAAMPGAQTMGPRLVQPGGATGVRVPWQSVAGASLVALGVASLGGAAALGAHAGLSADRALATRNEGVRQTAQASQDGALACLGVGLTLAAAGVTVLVLSPSKPGDSVPVVRASMHPQGASLQMIW